VFQIDPALLQPNYVPSTTRPDTMDVDATDVDTMDFDTIDAMDTASESSAEPGHQQNVMPPSSTTKRRRITKKNPIYGFVEGARRGAQKFG